MFSLKRAGTWKVLRAIPDVLETDAVRIFCCNMAWFKKEIMKQPNTVMYQKAQIAQDIYRVPMNKVFDAWLQFNGGVGGTLIPWSTEL